MLIDRSLVEAALPGYQVEGDLGKGGYGLVLAGQHRLIGRKVAIKILLDTSEDPELRSRFLSEARVLSEFDHPHIVRIHDYVEHEGTCLLVMELLSGGTLKQKMAAGRIEPESVCAIGLAAASALATAHSAGVLHRDVKPDNIMFDGSGLLKVTDFGIAKIFDGAETTASAILGTPRYMAPEQITGARLFPATDLYALAGVLYEMIAERPLFGRPMAVQPLTHHHLNVMPEPLTAVPPPVSNVIMKTLAKDPAARFSDATEFAIELARASCQSFGPNWLSRADIKIRVEDEIRDAALGASSSTASRAPRTPPGLFPPPTGPAGPAGFRPGPGAPGYQQPFPPAQPTPGPRPLPGQYGPRPPGVPAAPGQVFQPGPGRPPVTPPPGHPQYGAGPVPGAGWPGQTPPSQPLPPPAPATPGITPGPTPMPRSPVPQPTAPTFRPGAGWQQPGGAHRPPQRGGLFGLSRKATYLATALLFVLVAGLTTLIVLATRSSDGGDGGDGGSSAAGYVGPTLSVDGMQPYGLSIDEDGILYIPSFITDYVHTIAPDGTVAVLAGSGSTGFSGDGGPATAAEFDGPATVDWDAAGNIYISDALNFRVRKITPDGIITTVVGTGVEGFSGDGGQATAAQIAGVEGIAVADDGTLYLADYNNNRIRKVTPDGIITTIAGTGDAGFTPGPTPATQAQLNGPNGLVLAPDGTLYLGNIGSDTIQKITPDGMLSTVAGDGSTGDGGDGGLATDAQFDNPIPGLGPDGTLYIADYNNNKIRMVDAEGIVTTIAGTGTEGFSGDGGAATSAELAQPGAVVVDGSGAVYFPDNGNLRIRRIDPDGTISTVAVQTGV